MYLQTWLGVGTVAGHSGSCEVLEERGLLQGLNAEGGGGWEWEAVCANKSGMAEHAVGCCAIMGAKRDERGRMGAGSQ